MNFGGDTIQSIAKQLGSEARQQRAGEHVGNAAENMAAHESW